MSHAPAAGHGRLQGKSAIITGAAHGIGRATALRFASEGARVTLNDLDQAALDEVVEAVAAAGGVALSVAGDVSDTADVQRLVAEAVAAFGRVDILVANAGIIPEADLPAATAALWDRTMAVDARGMFLCCKYAAAEMLKVGGGAIVCLSSVSGFVGQKGQVIYGPAKFAASGLTKHLAVELAAQGIRVNAVAPGTSAMSSNTVRLRLSVTSSSAPPSTYSKAKFGARRWAICRRSSMVRAFDTSLPW
jgi:NAD(P)-dependent dehydrogenase (short-subunit alcohol dehydrogenase family)